MQCSVHLSNIASLSVRSVLPSALSRGKVPDVNASFNVSMSFLSAKDWSRIASAFLLLHASEPVLDRLTNVAAYRVNLDVSCACGAAIQEASGFLSSLSSNQPWCV